MGELSQAGSMVTVSCAGSWLALTGKEQLRAQIDDEAELLRVLSDFDDDDRIGDRRQELVIIGQISVEQEAAIQSELDGCLVNDEE
jgi:hypothetical protein